ncbi:MAG TPA: AAA family ATPase [Solirubrobacteraceae bacterium]
MPFGPDVPVVLTDDVAPYRGLRVFGEEDAQFFFGRDREIQRLLEKLKSSTFVAVLGPSGSGKSSLVRAGLVPELRAGALVEVEDWHVLVLRPGAAPLTALAAQLARLLPGQAMQSTLDALARDPRTMHLCVELALADRPSGERVLVVIDQLEEVFTLCTDPAERRLLFSTLSYATAAPGPRSVVIITMRSDFYGRCAAYPELAQLITAQQMLVGPMNTDGLRQAIEEPAHRVGLELEEGLSETILADVAAEPGALPLLEHALLELWERRRGAMLTLEGYRQTGGVHGALAQRADAILTCLTPDEQQIARRTLLRLTQPGEGTEDTRRRAARSELAPECDGRFDDVLARLVDARLLTTGRDETGVEVVDVSHEALIRGWPRLRDWIDADRAGLLIHRRLTDAAREWATLNREPGALYRGARLAAAREWASDHADDVNELEHDFLCISQATEQNELQAARRRKRFRVLAIGLTVVSVVVAAFAVWALGQRSAAQRQARETTSVALSLSAAPLLNKRPELALPLALEANRASPRAEARISAFAALTAARDPGVLAILHGHTDDVRSVALNRNGRMLASAGLDGTVRLWDLHTHKQTGALPTAHHEVIFGVAFSPDGHILASAGTDTTVRLWDVRTHKQLGEPLNGHKDAVNSVAFSPDGRTLASGGDDETVRMWDLKTHRQLGRSLTDHTDIVNSVAFSPDGRTLASGGADKTVRIWDTTTHRQLGPPLTGHTDVVNCVAFSPDGRTLAFGGDDQTVRIWDTKTHRQLGPAIIGHTDIVNSVAFSPDGRTLASGGADKTVRIWNTKTHRQLGRALIGHSSAVLSVVFSPDARTLASGSGDRTIRLWKTGTHRRLRTELTVHGGAFFSVAFSPDGHTLATAGAARTVLLWNMRTHRQLGAPLRGHTSAVLSVAFSHDGRTLASASGDETVRLWDTQSNLQLGSPLRGHTSFVNDVAFSSDDRTLASASNDDMIRLWDVRTHRQLGAPFGSVRGSV